MPSGKIFRNLTIYQRVEFLIGISLISLGALLVLFINAIAPLLVTSEVGVPNSVVLINTTNTYGTPITIMEETPAPSGFTISHNLNAIKTDPLLIVRVLSILGLVMIIGIGFFTSRWIAKISIKPIGQISQKAQKIDAKSLDQRINYLGPQDEVKILADTIDAMLNRLGTNFEQQGQFIGNLTHELRTPLSSLRMNIEAINLDPNANLEDYHNLSETAERALSRLEQLVEDLLLLAKGENEIAHEPIVIGVLVDEILEEIAPIAHDRKISLSMNGDIDSEIYGDPALLQCALSNLIKNSVLYNNSGGFVEVLIRHDNFKVIIEVRDNGIGIADNDQGKIFDRFYRCKNEQGENIPGKGLGLAIVKHIIDLHQGKIEVESKLGMGSTFRLYLFTTDVRNITLP